MMNNKQRKENSASIMLRSFILLVTIIIFVASISTVVAVGHELLETSNYNSSKIITSLKNTVIDGDHDWRNWRINNTLDTSTSYVHVHNMRKDAKTKNYYSPGTEKLLSKKMTEIPLIKNLYYRSNAGFYYYGTGHSRGIDYQLWTKVNNELELLIRIVAVLIVILLLTVVISPIYIRVITRRLTSPLSDLTESAESISKDGNRQLSLPVPDKPTEVTNLATSFNRLLDELEKKSEKEKLFVSNAAHELRTPIATIRSHAQLIQRRGREHPEIIPKSIEYINDESHQMQSLVDELLTLSRADRMTLDFDNYDLSQSLNNISDRLNAAIKQKINRQIEKDIRITANEESIEQIVTSLLSNAAKYSPNDSVITLKLDRINDVTQISVIDEGRGINDEDKPHIFDRFYRSNDVRGSIAGTGLGLSIANELSSLNHAQLSVSDNHPHGSIFTITFE
ncbi:HAMP domain-containing sensor histidine kinase [Paucilactobacillus suebicus]|uniref:histidine kinase n=1 Tax=Paucilactobacillus suebicus DSM 5007 = KCTC 3549 TaxID=1423807 RepID=A0A0R1W4Z8_9LACO|nr:signal transduction histidine kinase [Paucilactobacillus suebicus DSM 5007 = KCTC 3549]